MKPKKLANLPLNTLLQTARLAGQNAAIKAVSAGRRVAGWKDGHLVEYGQENVVIAQSSYKARLYRVRRYDDENPD